MYEDFKFVQSVLSVCILLPVKCLNCKAVSDRHEPFLNITLDIEVRCFVNVGRAV